MKLYISIKYVDFLEISRNIFKDGSNLAEINQNVRNVKKTISSRKGERMEALSFKRP